MDFEREIKKLKKQICCQNDIIDALTESLNSITNLGFAQYTDTQYTEISPFSISANTDTQLPNNKGSVLVLQQANNGFDVNNWVDNTGKIIPDTGNGDGYLIRISFVADPNLNNRNLTLKLDIGGTQGVIYEETIRLARGAGVDTNVGFTIPYYTLNTFLINGGTFLINCDGDVNIYNIVYLIQKTLIV